MPTPEPLHPIYPPTLTAEDSEQLVSTIKDWSLAHGLAVRPPPTLVAADSDPHGILAMTAPVTLFPSPFPRVCYEQALSIQQAYNQLYANISQDAGFLESIVQEIVEVDEFIADLWKVHLQVLNEDYTQGLSLGLFRSDYMVHQNTPDESPHIKQVEFNTIASSFGGLSSQTSKLHQFLSKAEYPLLQSSSQPLNLDLPANSSVHSLASGLRVAFRKYVDSEPTHDCCVLFLVQDTERNIFDQRHLEYELRQSNIPVYRLPFSQILSQTSISTDSKRLLLYSHPNNPSKVFEVAVVYFRAGYGPQDYPNKAAWDARLQIERSYAIKCPSILTQLAGAKKVQQVLATPSTISESPLRSRFMKTNPEDVSELESTFTNIFPLDESPAGLAARKIALDPKKCLNYVLKPQREGGGNNVYRASIPPFLESLPKTHWKSYILMELIVPPPVQNSILRNGVIEKGGVICELGVYGCCLWDSNTNKTLYNEEAGYLLRTKGDTSEEGGVAAGFGAMDSCCLI